MYAVMMKGLAVWWLGVVSLFVVHLFFPRIEYFLYV